MARIIDDLHEPALCFIGGAFVSFLLVTGIARAIGKSHGRNKRVSVRDLCESGTRLVDPFTIRLHEKLRPIKQAAIKEGQWGRFCMLILGNNVFLAALVQRVLFGMIVPYGLFLSARGTYGRALLTAKLSRPFPLTARLLALFEFGAYWVASLVAFRSARASFSLGSV